MRQRALRTETGEGFLLGERYWTELEPHGGSSGSTHYGKDVQTGEPIIIKEYRLEDHSVRTKTAIAKRIENLNLISPHSIAPVLHSTWDQNILYIVRPFINGFPLDGKFKKTQMTVTEVLDFAKVILERLAQLHQNHLFHGNLKPSNLILKSNTEVNSLTLVDLYLPPTFLSVGGSKTSSLSEARCFSPERNGLLNFEVDQRSDLYSAGVLLFQLLTGKFPYDGNNVGEILRNHLSEHPKSYSRTGVQVPHAFQEIVTHLFERAVEDRYQTAASALSDISALGVALEQGQANPAIIVGKSDTRGVLGEPAFIGRSSDLEELEKALVDCSNGFGGLYLVEAQSGTGKTRLLQELCQRAQARNVLALWGQGIDQGAQRPYQVIVGVAQKVAELAGSDLRLQNSLKEQLKDYSQTVVTALPELKNILSISALPEPGPEGFGEMRSLESLSRFLNAIGTLKHPAVIVLDDCQWADEFTLRLLKNWQSQNDSKKNRNSFVTIVVAFRSEEVSSNHSLRKLNFSKHQSLKNLNAAEVQELVESMAGPVPTEIIKIVFELSGGNPFMATAVVRGLVESGGLFEGKKGWMVDDSKVRYLQSSLHAAQFLVRRLELLPQAHLDFLSAGAVLGKDFGLEMAALLAQQSIEESKLAAEEARARGIVWRRGAENQYSFVHDQLREALLTRMNSEDRKRLHGLAGELLERTDPGSHFELAYHFDASGNSTRALPYAILAAEKARSQHSLDISIQQYRIALNGVKPENLENLIRIHEGLGDVLLLRGDYEQAEIHLKKTLDLANGKLEHARLMGKLGDLEFKRGNVAQASLEIEEGLRSLGIYIPHSTLIYATLAIWEAVIQLFHTLMPRYFLARRRLGESSKEEFLSIRLLSRLAYVYWFQKGKLACAWAHLREMNRAERYPATPELAQAYSEHAPVMTMVPLFDRAIEYAEKSLQIRKNLGDVWGQGQSLHFYGVALYAASRFEECIVKCTEAAQLLGRTGDQWEVNTANWHVGFSLYRQGKLRQAITVFRNVFETGRSLGDHQATAISLSGWCKASNGQVSSEIIRNELKRNTGDVHTQLELTQGEAIRLLREGKSEQAIIVLRRTYQKIKRAGFQSEYVAPVLPLLATALRCEIEKAKQEFASAHWKQLLIEFDTVSRKAVLLSRKYKNNLPHALRERAIYHAMKGDERKAKRDLENSQAIARRLGSQYELAQTLLIKERLCREVSWPVNESEIGEAQRLLEACDIPVESAFEQLPSIKEKKVTLSLVDRFETIIDVGRQIATSLTTKDLVVAVERACIRLLRAEQCLLLKLDGNTLKPFDGSKPFSYSEEMVRQALNTGKSVVLGEGVKGFFSEWMALAGVRSALCCPIKMRGEVIGCFYLVHHKVVSLFGAEEMRLADFVATLAGAAFENAEGFAELMRLNSDLKCRMAEAQIAEGKLKQSTSELKRSNNELEQFAYVASHDLKEPLRMVNNFVHLLAEEYQDKLTEEAKEYIRFASEGAARMTELIDALLSYSRIGNTGEGMGLTNFNEVFREVLANLQSGIEETGATITCLELPTLWADKMQMIQLFQNLVGNALKFRSDEHPRIEISAKIEDDHWHFSVTDNGIGIEPRYAERIFIIFQRLHQRDRYPGTGIGLAICKKAVQQHSGRIWVESQLGRGSVFHFTIAKDLKERVSPAEGKVIPFPRLGASQNE